MKNDTVARVLLTVGGEGRRLKSAGRSVPISKSFLEINGRPLLYWNVLIFKKLGVNTMVICAENEYKLSAAAELISSACPSFSKLEYHLDEGSGTAGLPLHCRQYFDGPFLFATGHSIVKPEHYAEMARLKSSSNIVVSAFESYKDARGVFLPPRHKADLSNSWGEGYLFIDNPVAIDEEYLDCLSKENFNLFSTLQVYHKRGKLLTVKSDLPAEIDEVSQLDHVSEEISRYIASAFTDTSWQ